MPAASSFGLVQALFYPDSDEEPVDYNAIELVISFEENKINIKELSAYLEFIYRLDGHLSDLGFARYSHNPSLQIEIDEIRFGSWEIIIERTLDTIDAENLIVIFMALRFLPKIIQTFVDGSYKVYQVLDIREDYLEKREKRKRRSEFRKLINDDVEFSSLPKKQVEKLVDALEKLYDKAGNSAVPASRLSQKSVREVKLRPKRK